MESNNDKPRPEDLVDLADEEQKSPVTIEIKTEEPSEHADGHSNEGSNSSPEPIATESSTEDTEQDSQTSQEVAPQEGASATEDAPSQVVPSTSEMFASSVVSQKTKKPLFKKILTTKKILIPALVVIILGALLTVPLTRYSALGLVLKKDVVINANDSDSKNPVSEAVISLNGQDIKTDGEGKALFKAVPVGQYEVKVSKKNYADATSKITVPVLGGQKSDTGYALAIKATGRPLAVMVVNKISGKPIAGAMVKVGDAEAKSGDDGTANLVITPGQAKQKISVSNSGFNSYDVDIEIKQSGDNEAKAELTASGKVYFLSKKSGKIDVVKTNLDGTERQTVLAGTGKEDDRQTVMLASRDWKYLALLSRREGNVAKLYLIETASDKVTPMDEGNADFGLTGWAEESFIYTVTRKNVQPWQDKREALKAYNASTKTIKTLAESTGSGTNYADQKSDSINGVIAVGKEVVFTKYGTGAESSINSIKTDGSGLKKLKASAAGNTVVASLYEPKEIYVGINAYEGATNAEYFEYNIGGSALEKISKEDYDKGLEYPTYLLSPSGTKNFWSEERDGRPVLFVGDDNGGNEKQYQSGDQKYKQYGWFSDEYVLVSLKDSELYIAGSDNLEGKKFVKISDYHKPAQTFLGYGGGYGGF